MKNKQRNTLKTMKQFPWKLMVYFLVSIKVYFIFSISEFHFRVIVNSVCDGIRVRSFNDETFKNIN